jgi:uncharacterized protein (DUF1501 family)
MTSLTRRRFLRTGVTGGAAAMALQRLGLLTEMTAAAGSYRALVCIFLFGGNDSNNLVVPVDDYASYAAVRGTGSPLNLPREQLLAVSPASAGAVFGLHPSLAPLHPLWTEQRVALVCNVGPLIEPLTRQQYLARNAQVPVNLFSHSDQQAQWQTCVSSGPSATGWGGRTADRFEMSDTFPTMITVAGLTPFTAASVARPLAMTPGQTFGLSGYTSTSAATTARYTALRQLLDLDADQRLIGNASATTALALENSKLLATLPAVPTVFPATSIGNQLKQVAQLIKLNRDQLNLPRQLFFCSLGGFDTHNAQLATHATLLAQLAASMAAFDAAMQALTLSDAVTTFTLSDFARTLRANNTSGTDHAWGGHHVVMGGAVRGGDFYGRYPSLAPNGPDDTDSGPGARGRWIPTTAVDQYAATLATWYGVAAVDLPAVFPNLGRFNTADLGFLRS